MEVAFDLHSGAYRAAGLGHLGVVDQAQVRDGRTDVLAAALFSALGMFAKSIDMALQPSDDTLRMMGTNLLLIHGDP